MGGGCRVGGYLLQGTGFGLSLAILAVPGLSIAGPGPTRLAPFAPFQSQDLAKVSPTSQPVRVVKQRRGGSA